MSTPDTDSHNHTGTSERLRGHVYQNRPPENFSFETNFKPKYLINPSHGQQNYKPPRPKQPRKCNGRSENRIFRAVPRAIMPYARARAVIILRNNVRRACARMMQCPRGCVHLQCRAHARKGRLAGKREDFLVSAPTFRERRGRALDRFVFSPTGVCAHEKKS